MGSLLNSNGGHSTVRCGPKMGIHDMSILLFWGRLCTRRSRPMTARTWAWTRGSTDQWGYTWPFSIPCESEAIPVRIESERYRRRTQLHAVRQDNANLSGSKNRGSRRRMKQMRDISEEKQTVPTSQEVDAKKEVARASRLLEVRANPPAVPRTYPIPRMNG